MNASSEKSLESLTQAICDGDIEKFVVEVNDFFKSVGSHIPHSVLNLLIMLFQQLYDVPDEYLVSVCDMERRLSKVDKATGLDDIPAWVLRDFAHTLVGH